MHNLSASSSWFYVDIVGRVGEDQILDLADEFPKILHGVAVCCSVLQPVLQCVAVYYSRYV